VIKKMFSFFLVIALGIVFFHTFANIASPRELSGVSARYAERGAGELGAANLVTAIVVTYRGLDTLGEVSVLFLAATGIAVLLRRRKGGAQTPAAEKRGSSEILRTGTDLLVPIIVLFGAYIFINGHLSPGGGFQGGAVVASSVMLSFLADPAYKLNHTVLGIIESMSGFFYVLAGVLGIFLAGGFLDSRILPLGTFGNILSAGAIPVIYTLIGLKVGT
jgi:multicomponent Na+:H+ antiporter subunit B